MDSQYEYSKIENKWNELWKNTKKSEDKNKPKYYCLDMFPYPSASGLHVGHWRGYVLSDVITRYKILNGYEVLHPMGFDAFGLPTENYAIKVGVHPLKVTEESVENYKRQLNDIGATYDWDREINTTDPNYYKWTQWIFIKMFEEGLAYEKEMPLNWCPSCKAVLANEEATNSTCDRCGSTVTKKLLRQWMLKITKYAERLLNDLDELDWPEKVKKMQAEWIGKSKGSLVNFKVDNNDSMLEVFTTRPDTIYGATFIVLAPEHSLTLEITTSEQKEEIESYILKSSTKSSVDRLSEKEKTGVFTGSYAINPINNKKIPIWISDYVLADYGTGAIMCVPAHDNRDFEFAKKFDLPIVQVIKKENENLQQLSEAFTEEGVMVNSDTFDNMPSLQAKEEIAKYIQENNLGENKVNYKLRDWVFSRQRYWGEPIPLIHCNNCGTVPVPENELPVVLPNVEKYQPTETGESPLADIKEWVKTNCPKCGGSAKRETNTMPQWAGSSWYFLRYADPHNNTELASKENLTKYLPVDMYVGGIEHAVLHLLYARFYTKFLYDIGVVDFKEPFKKLFNQGMLNKDGMKMSKSKGNVVSPDDIIKVYGRDSLRMYELFVGPPELDTEWDDSGIDGVFRYLKKVWKLVYDYKDKNIKTNKDFDFIRNKLVYEITNRVENFTFNTVISGFMEYTNKIIELAKKHNGIDKETLETLILLLAPFAPHISEEMWQIMGNESSIFNETWPTYDTEKIKLDTIEIALQINGKLRETLTINTDDAKEDILNKAKELLADKLIEKQIVKEIYVPNKIVNLVVK